MKIILLSVVAFGLVLAGCATVTRGTDQPVHFHSVPPGAQMQTSTGFACSTTPCTLRMKRRSEFTATFTKPGCEPVEVLVGNEISAKGGAGLVGNAIIGGVVGVGVDMVTGATQEIQPNPVVANLVCDSSVTNPALRAPKQTPKGLNPL